MAFANVQVDHSVIVGAVYVDEPGLATEALVDVVEELTGSVDVGGDNDVAIAREINGGAGAGTYFVASNSLGGSNEAGIQFYTSSTTFRASLVAHATSTTLSSSQQLKLDYSGGGIKLALNDAGVRISSTGGFVAGTSTFELLQGAASGIGNIPLFLITTGTNTSNLSASTENIDVRINTSATRTFSTGAITTQRNMVVIAPTYAFSGASTITTAATLAVTGAPVAGTNATLTRRFSFLSQADTGLFTLDGGIEKILARPAVIRGATAIATIVQVAPGAELRLDALRAAFGNGIEAGASAFDGILIARIVAPDGFTLRRALLDALAALGRVPPPAFTL